jgi:hypothetical protein
MSVDEVSVDEMSVDEISVDEMSADKMPIDKMSVDKSQKSLRNQTKLKWVFVKDTTARQVRHSKRLWRGILGMTEPKTVHLSRGHLNTVFYQNLLEATDFFYNCSRRL